MKASTPAKLCLLLSLAAAPAHAQTDRSGPDAIAASLSEILALVTLGAVTTQDQAPQITQSGADYLVRLPLKGFTTPPDAAVNAVAHPLDGGLWDIASMTFPSAGTVEMTAAHAGVTRIAYSIGQQAIHMRIDPSFAQSSSFAADVGSIKLHTDQGDHHSEQVFDRYVADGTVSSEAPGQLNFSSRGKATNWHLTVQEPNGIAADGLVRTLSGKVAVEGLDRAQGTRLMAATRALMDGAQTAAPSGQIPSISPVQRQSLRAVVDALSGLLTRFSAEETLNDIRFSVGPTNGGTLGHVRVNMTGDSARGRLNAGLNIAMDDLAVSALPAETAAYVPRHFGIKSVLAGVRTGPLTALLHAAAEPNADASALQAQFMALFSEPEARIAIESLTFDSGPMQVTGSARFVPRPNGQLGADIHFSAIGMDAFMAKAQAVPAMQQALPVMFMAKGMGRQEGGAMVWDIALGDGPPTVNGVPFGQPAPRKR